jgi:hypothetical protein
MCSIEALCFLGLGNWIARWCGGNKAVFVEVVCGCPQPYRSAHVAVADS